MVNHETEKQPKVSPDFCEPMVNKSDHIKMVPEKHGDTIAGENFEEDLKDSGNWKHLYRGHPSNNFFLSQFVLNFSRIFVFEPLDTMNLRGVKSSSCLLWWCYFAYNIILQVGHAVQLLCL